VDRFAFQNSFSIGIFFSFDLPFETYARLPTKAQRRSFAGTSRLEAKEGTGNPQMTGRY
jgi:hypothetical protein